jgi:hypothetical protein
MRLFAVFLFFGFIIQCASGQNLIGYKENEIRKYMRENKKDMSLNKVTNSKFNYLKYSDSSDSQTMLFFLNKDSVCQSIRIICDENAKALRLKEFNSAYKKNNDNRWVDSHNGKSFMIELREEKWASVITMELYK